jgi:tRNA threonylcarbamoyladenosine biosynthesis protein TsaB
MALILNIETATQVCSVALSKDGHLLALREYSEKNAHAEVLTPLIQELISEAKVHLTDLDAIAVSEGPGSYTGLRIGVSTAKGLCYSLDKPLISIPTLSSMAQWAAQNLKSKLTKDSLLFPMIDARRMEVYTCQFDYQLKQLNETAPLIFDEETFVEGYSGKELVLFGDGCQKSTVLFSERKNITIYPEILCSAQGMLQLAEDKFKNSDFVDLAYFEPFYLKEFIAGIPKVKGLR